MSYLPLARASSVARSPWLTVWNVWRPRLRGLMGHGCPQLQTRAGPAVDLFSITLAGAMPRSHAESNRCVLLDSGTCDGRCGEVLEIV